MAKKRYSSEQIIVKLREAEVFPDEKSFQDFYGMSSTRAPTHLVLINASRRVDSSR